MSVFGSEASQKAPGEGPGISSLFIRQREQAERPADRAKTPGSAPDADANLSLRARRSCRTFSFFFSLKV
ncbi:hypothetical protein NQZ68_035008 [Dissostichus eleginoides]|nr:hypothetical protein NQZ68_035008 [Dissostichus eleginoides]